MSETKTLESANHKLFFNESGEPRTWTLFYRFGNRPVIEKHFFFDGDLMAARKRGIQHCDVMGYIFIFVRPFIVDLTYQESMKVAGKYKDPDAREGEG